MIDIFKIVDEASKIIEEDGVTIYKETCPIDFIRPSYFISTVMDNTTFDTDINMNVHLTLMITSFQKTDARGNCNVKELIHSAMDVKNRFASVGGVYVENNFLQINNIKIEFGLDTANIALTLQYTDIPNNKMPEYETMQDITIISNMKSGDGK